MRLNIVAPLLASAALASAVPLRVVIVASGSSNGTVAHHAGHGGDDAHVAHLMKPTSEMEHEIPGAKWLASPEHQQEEGKHPRPHHHGRPCAHRKGKGMFRSKWISISNTFRGAFGMPLIEIHEKFEGKMHGGMLRVTTTKFVGKPGEHPHHPPPPHMMMDGPHPHHHHHPEGHKHHMRPFHHHGGSSFLQRIQVALMTLGPWEGRAVAFVLGCGLGVLLRMLWVLSVVTFRAIKGRKEEEDRDEVQYTQIIYEYTDDAEQIAVPPPNYNYPVDEKVAVAEESK